MDENLELEKNKIISKLHMGNGMFRVVAADEDGLLYSYIVTEDPNDNSEPVSKSNTLELESQYKIRQLQKDHG